MRTCETLALTLLTTAAFLSGEAWVGRQDTTYASCSIESGSGTGTVHGSIILSQPTDESKVTLVITLNGLVPAGLHGFHVHANASIGSQCNEAAGHLNNLKTLHGAPNDSIKNRHTGDLGNIPADANGNVAVTISDWLISLTGENSVIGKPIVVHALEDDLGKGGAPSSNTTGNAGARLGCCLIVQLHESGSRWRTREAVAPLKRFRKRRKSKKKTSCRKISLGGS